MARSTLAELLERFDIVALVAEGTTSAVFAAFDRTTGKRVALKVLRPSGHPDRFLREALVLSSVRHANLVRYVGHGVTSQRQPWLAMDWLEGEGLDARVAHAKLSVDETFALARTLGGALSCLHRRSLVHRDLQPSNVCLVGGDVRRATLLDFGLARVVGGDDLTRKGELVGTPAFMAPEQVRDAPKVDTRADVFSLGAVLYYALAGFSPFAGKTFLETLTNLLRETPPPVVLARPDVPVQLADLIGRMLSKDPSRRPATGAEVAAALAASSDTGPFSQTLRFGLPLKKRSDASSSYP